MIPGSIATAAPDDIALEFEMAQRRLVVEEARSWLGTPYRVAANVKGAGIDCAMILIEVYAAAGVIEWRDPRPYPPDYYLHNKSPRYLNEVGMHAVEITREQANIGDTILFKFGHAPAHSGIIIDMTNLTMVHSYKGRGCVVDELDRTPWLASRIDSFWTMWPRRE
jgi:NlpC/P60 family putative phage cell wall peptidase